MRVESRRTAVARQLDDHINKHGLLPRYQTGISIRHHLTETAMLRVVSDALTTAADGRHVTLYSLRTGTRTSVRTVCDLTAHRPL